MGGVGGGGSTGVPGPSSVMACAAARGAEMEGLLDPMERLARTKGLWVPFPPSSGPLLPPTSRSRRMGEVASLEDPLDSRRGFKGVLPGFTPMGFSENLSTLPLLLLLLPPSSSGFIPPSPSPPLPPLLSLGGLTSLLRSMPLKLKLPPRLQ